MYKYLHKVKYYETDKMGVTHHSNYIRFMEEARIEWMDSIGLSYKECEASSIISPVVSVSCRYKKTTTFDDLIEIQVRLRQYNGLKLTVSYEMYKDGEIAALGESEHCFLSEAGLPLRLKKEAPRMDELLRKELEKEMQNESP